MTLNQVFVPRTRSQRGLPPPNPEGEDTLGTTGSISNEVLKELRDALDNSHIGAAVSVSGYLVRPCLQHASEMARCSFPPQLSVVSCT
jgi:omega-6 fatty acid desaturase / acyl-lipid omega-6 desaturase (Delta-12 desaturase)